MIRATLSVRGLYRHDPTIFDELVLPEEIDREDLIDTLTIECAEFELLYPQPDVLRQAIGLWSRRLLPQWEQLVETLHYEYDPIYNYDRTESHSREASREYADEGSSTSSGSGTSTGSRNAYNGGWKEQDKAVSSNSATASNERTGSQSETEGITIRAYGNIGVTTSQEMIEAQRRVVQYNVESVIIDSFQRKFCLLVY